jgi:hypothetical protein
MTRIGDHQISLPNLPLHPYHPTLLAYGTLRMWNAQTIRPQAPYKFPSPAHRRFGPTEALNALAATDTGVIVEAAPEFLLAEREISGPSRASPAPPERRRDPQDMNPDDVDRPAPLRYAINHPTKALPISKTKLIKFS